MQRITILFYFFLFVTTFFLSRCANPVSPVGGPKDITPPRVLACLPPNYGAKFKEKGFSITFDEYIVLKNTANEVFISPPLKHPLETKLHGKELIVKFNDSLSSNTTYSVTFGNAIADLNENNILKGFNYVLSTGDFVDSLSLQGTVVTAFDHKPQKGVFVELYLDNNDTLAFDSLPLHVQPYYLTKTVENGTFLFNNLQNRQYKLFALADQNGDLIFNQPTEKIAFTDSLVNPIYFSKQKTDTSHKDSTQKKLPVPETVRPGNAGLLRKADSVHKADSILKNHLLYPAHPLFLFEQTDSVQRLVKANFPREGMTLFTFRFPVHTFRIIPLNFDSVAPWYLEEYSNQRDSLILWITRPKTDSLTAKVILDNKIHDTVNLGFIKKDIHKKSSKKAATEQLTVLNPAKVNGLNQFKNKLTLTFSFPLIRWDFKKVLLIVDKDTLHPEIEFSDSLKRKIIITHKWKEDTHYKIIIPDSVFYGITGISHDSILLDFRTRAERELGNLVVNMDLDKRPGQYIVQLLGNDESSVYEEKIVTQSGKIRFDFLVPGLYKLKLINDRNTNRKWDTGNYKLKIQPEEVIYLPKIIEIRANWDVEETWD